VQAEGHNSQKAKRNGTPLRQIFSIFFAIVQQLTWRIKHKNQAARSVIKLLRRADHQTCPGCPGVPWSLPWISRSPDHRIL